MITLTTVHVRPYEYLWADDRFGLSPMLTLAGIAIGLVVALAGMIRMLMAVLRYVSESD